MNEVGLVGKLEVFLKTVLLCKFSSGHQVDGVPLALVSRYRGLFSRSIFAMVDVYNNLPQQAVDAPAVTISNNI